MGFIGSSLARRLVAEGSDVVIMDSLIPTYGGNLFNIADIRDRVDVHISDVRDRHSIRALLEGVRTTCSIWPARPATWIR